jgi:L-alanine-DL-glutamate epimerase-like enolase superfamily enzyme
MCQGLVFAIGLQRKQVYVTPMTDAAFKTALTTRIWPIKGEFRLSRGSRTAVEALQLTLTCDGFTGRSEAIPYARYNESVASVVQQLEPIISRLERDLTPETLIHLLPAGAARNLCDLALWDWRAKATGRHVWEMTSLPEPKPVSTAYTLSLDEPNIMAEAAHQAARYPLLKLKLGTPEDELRLRAIHAARPDAHLIVDANEGWTLNQLKTLSHVMAECGVVLCEQPLPVGQDAALHGLTFPFRLCADESIHTAADIPALARHYQAVNIKLDKTGGLTGAIQAIRVARAHKLDIMIGCMLASSLALAPAVLLASGAEWVDLDGPLLLAEDTKPGLDYDGPRLSPPRPELWG